MKDLAILVPVLHRPHRVAPLLDSIRFATPDARVLFITDPDDIAERDEIEECGGEQIAFQGNYAEKINEGCRRTNEPWIFTGADDLEFHPGWFHAAKLASVATGCGLVGTQDLCNARTIAGEHATHFLMQRRYAELPTIDGQPGPLFEGYQHEYVDDELVGTAKARDEWVFAPAAVVEHLHPDAGKAPMDDLYAGQRARMRASRHLFEERKPLWI